MLFTSLQLFFVRLGSLRVSFCIMGPVWTRGLCDLLSIYYFYASLKAIFAINEFTNCSLSSTFLPLFWWYSLLYDDFGSLVSALWKRTEDWDFNLLVFYFEGDDRSDKVIINFWCEFSTFLTGFNSLILSSGWPYFGVWFRWSCSPLLRLAVS